MAKLMARILGTVAAVVLSATTVGYGVASADPLKGMTYSDAAAAVAKYKGTAVIATVTGDQLEVDKCIVTSWHTSIFLDSSGTNNRRREYRMNLNCNNLVAAPGQPGNSSMSPEGAQAKTDQAAAEIINKNPAWCQKDAKHMRWCGDICKRSGLCEI